LSQRQLKPLGFRGQVTDETGESKNLRGPWPFTAYAASDLTG